MKCQVRHQLSAILTKGQILCSSVTNMRTTEGSKTKQLFLQLRTIVRNWIITDPYLENCIEMMKDATANLLDVIVLSVTKEDRRWHFIITVVSHKYIAKNLTSIAPTCCSIAFLPLIYSQKCHFLIIITQSVLLCKVIIRRCLLHLIYQEHSPTLLCFSFIPFCGHMPTC